ncbi:MAG TPA: cyclic nucleotide-binding domain-containing protein, partial [Acidimicrobiales bacterium]
LQTADYFGEVAIVTGGCRMATVTATSPTTVLRLTSSSYVQYLSHTGDVQARMTEMATTRIGEPPHPPDN